MRKYHIVIEIESEGFPEGMNYGTTADNEFTLTLPFKDKMAVNYVKIPKPKRYKNFIFYYRKATKNKRTRSRCNFKDTFEVPQG